MRRFCVLTMLVLGVLTIIIGAAEAHVHPTTLPIPHIVIASLFTLVCIVHIVINRKALLKYIKAK